MGNNKSKQSITDINKKKFMSQFVNKQQYQYQWQENQTYTASANTTRLFIEKLNNILLKFFL